MVFSLIFPAPEFYIVKFNKQASELK